MKTLYRIGHELSSPARQKELLGDPRWVAAGRFEDMLKASGSVKLVAKEIQVLQINVGKVCNQTCSHCHVDAGPDRRENMSSETAADIIRFLAGSKIPTLDITGGAPEMNPNFQWIVEQARALGRNVIDRCNLTILSAPGFQHLPEFLCRNKVRIIASLPCYLEENCDRQRGDGVFEKSIRGLQRLNDLGYGDDDGILKLDLVYNPVGTSLPPNQIRLETDYRRQLSERFGIRFSQLFTITNMPISRYLDDLVRQGEYMNYMNKLIDGFNGDTTEHLMCRETLSVDWKGKLFDCDFNQMLDLPIDSLHISNCDLQQLTQRTIRTGNHCFGCTAGCGSSCQGTTVNAAE